ncbi:uncharacterized protein isoform X4 [Choristoneura fumiferana]|uniref:uncharacterized protein isoform X4 n=1 Tax=Choristoneura fumiferana TaxID=7141 RepID=UPI003D156815
MNQGDQNINKDMIDCDLIDVESLDFSDDQTWLYTAPEDAGENLDIVDWQLSFDWPFTEDDDYLKAESELYSLLDNLLKNEILAVPDKHKFDSRTYVRPKKRAQRPSIQSIVESSPPSLPSQPNKYLTYNKYSAPLGPLSPILRLKTFNVETDTENSNVIKEYTKRRSLVSEEDPQLEDIDMTLLSEGSERLSSENLPSKPINIDLSQPAHNLHNTFNKGLTNMMNERGSLNMYQSGESLMRMSPPSLVSSLMMESSGNFNPESLDSRKSLPPQRDSDTLRVPVSGRESIDPMMTSMTLSILEEKDMSTSFLSQTTYPDNDSLMDSLPPSLVSSVNSSFVVSNTSKARESTDSNIFSSATFTHLDQSEKLLSARPRHQPFNHLPKRDSGIKNSESYTKSREEACQIDPGKILVENGDKNTLKTLKTEMSETVTLHYSNMKFRRDEKENLNSTFEKDNAFYKDMNMPRTPDLGRNSLNVTMDKQELNEIIQARQKLSLARKALPEPEKLPNQVETVKTIQLPNQTITVPRQSMENASELLSRRRMNVNSSDKEEPTRDTPKRYSTFKVSPRASSLDATVVYPKKDENALIDINLATTNLIESGERTLREGWGSQERAMVCSSESTDTGTFSSSSPPESVPDTVDPRSQTSSTPLVTFHRGTKDLLNIHATISPIYDMVGDKSYTVAKAPSANSSMDRTYDMNATVINSATMVKKSAKRDILGGKVSPEKKMFGPSLPVKSISTGSYGMMAPPVAVARKTGLPTSKLRQYSSHKELSRIPGNTNVPRALPLRASNMARRGVYASNPALSPTQPAPPIRRDSYTLDDAQDLELSRPKAAVLPTAPPALVRQGTETIKRDRPQSQLVAPRDPPTTRPYSVAGASQLRVARPASGPTLKPTPAATPAPEPRPASSAEPRASGLPRPSRLPAPRRALRPPSVYSVAPTADFDHY